MKSIKDRPASVTVQVGGRPLTFIWVAGDQYAAELDGTRRVIRSRLESGTISESGRRDEYTPVSAQGETANIDILLRCLDGGATPTQAARGLELQTVEPGYHFRENTFLDATLTLADDGAVEFRASIVKQDDSYY